MKQQTRYHAALTVVALAVAGCRDGRATPVTQRAAPPATVHAEPVTDTVMARRVVAAGTVAAHDEVTLGFKVGGAIAALRVDEGDVVRAGQSLATLALDETDAAVAQARAAAAKAERDLGRAERLYRDSVVTLAQRQDAETAVQIARAGVRAASLNRRYAEIVAPFDGVVLARKADAGQIVAPGGPVLVVGSRGRGTIVRVAVTDRDAMALRIGDAATVRFDALAGATVPATVTRLAARADAATGTFLAELTTRGGPVLLSGMVGEAHIDAGRGVRSQRVPLAAVLEADGERGTVFVLSADGRRAQRRQVRLGEIDGSSVAVLSGLDGVERVITGGASYLADNVSVRVTP